MKFSHLRGEVVATVRVTGTETVAVLCQLIARATGAPCFAVWNRGVETAWNWFGTGESMVFRMEHPSLNGWCRGISILGKSDLLDSGGLTRVFTQHLHFVLLHSYHWHNINGNYGGTSPLLALPPCYWNGGWRPWWNGTRHADGGQGKLLPCGSCWKTLEIPMGFCGGNTCGELAAP